MKKFLCLFLALILCLSLCACGHEHVYGEWTTVCTPDCTNAGSKERVCECGAREVVDIDATGHKYDTVEQIVEVTCTQDGQTVKTCSVCGHVQTETQTAKGHSFKAATAFRPKTCSICGETEGEALATVISVGDTIESEDHAFTVEKFEFTGSLKEKRGNITYNHSSDFALAIKLSFTNLATEALDRWNSDRFADISMEYQGKYRYEGEAWIPVDDIISLAEDTVYIVYEVPKSMKEDASGSILVTFTIDDETYAMIVQEGDGAVEEEGASSTDASSSIDVGDERTNNTTFSFVLDDVYYTSNPSYSSGNVTYSFSNNGSYYLALKLDFTNLDEAVMDSWNSNRVTDMVLTHADKYTYEGDCWIPEYEIVPLDNDYLFILFAVPKNVESSSDSLVATFSVDGNDFTVNCR